MFTVIIAEKKHIDWLKKSILYTDVFRDDEQFVFCPWNTKGQSIETALPTLYECVGKRQSWKAIVLADCFDKNKKNPFDVSEYKKVEVPFATDENELKKNYDEELQRRLNAYDKSKENPLTVLAHLIYGYKDEDDYEDLNQKEIEDREQKIATKDNFYKMYVETSAKKDELLETYRKRLLEVSKPKEILCISPRFFKNDKYELVNGWESYDEVYYSEFCEYNLYPSQLRFLVFDTVKDTHSQYKAYELKLLVTLFTFATNDRPVGSIPPFRLYKVKCRYSKKAFHKLFTNYEKKLHASYNAINRKIHKLNEIDPDKKNENDYLLLEKVTMSPETSIDNSDLTINYKGIRLAKDIPNDEEVLWDDEKKKSSKNLKLFLKQPRRIVSGGLKDSLGEKEYDEDDVLLMDKFQIEDIQELANESEERISSTKTENIYKIKDYKKRLNQKEDKVTNYIKKRMTLSKIIFALLAVVGCMVVSGVPLIVDAIKNYSSIPYHLILFGLVILGIVLLGIVPLVVFRLILGFRIKDYNKEILAIRQEMDKILQDLGVYLSNVKTLRKCNDIMEIYACGGKEKRIKINNLKKHKNDISENIDVCRSILDTVHVKEKDADNNDKEIEPYDYDFLREESYYYPLPLDGIDKKKIDFVFKGNEVVLPIDFIENIIVSREEIHD